MKYNFQLLYYNGCRAVMYFTCPIWSHTISEAKKIVDEDCEWKEQISSEEP